jgi:hypothetical protein
MARPCFLASVAWGLCLALQAQTQASGSDAVADDVVTPLPCERATSSCATISLNDKQALFSQLRHEGRMGGRQFGWEIRATKVEAGVLIEPQLIRYDYRCQPYAYWRAKTIELYPDAKDPYLAIRMTEAEVCFLDGTRVKRPSKWVMFLAAIPADGR